MPKGFFLTFEGLDGSGKSTQVRLLVEWLEARGEHVIVTRQPGGTRIGDRIRGLLLDSRTESPAPMAELGLMFADRAQALAEVILPALSCGSVVVCDRFTDSTEAYQGGGRGLGSEIVLQLHQTMCAGLMPDLTILLLPNFAASLVRAQRRNKHRSVDGIDEERFEREGEEFYQRVFDKYCEIAEREPLRVVVIDGDAPVQDIHRRIVPVVAARLRVFRSA